MELTVADVSGRRLFVTDAFELEQEADGGLWEARLPAARYDAAMLHGHAYVDGEEWGGVVDDIGVDRSGRSALAVIGGRTWRGMLSRMVVMPGAGHYVATGDANRAISDILYHVGAGAPFAVDEAAAGVEVSRELTRFCTVLEGIDEMLAPVGLALGVRRAYGKVVLSAVPAARLHLSAAECGMHAVRKTRPVNHLVCAGEGQDGQRALVHLYADASGRISRTQSLFWPDEVAETYEFTSADEEQLAENGEKKLRDYQAFADADAEVPKGASARAGDTVAFLDDATGFSGTLRISGVNATVGRRGASLDFEAEAPALDAKGMMTWP